MSGMSSSPQGRAAENYQSANENALGFLRALGVSAVNWFEIYVASAAAAFSAGTPLGRSVTQSVCTRSHP